MKQLALPLLAGLALTGCVTPYGWSEAPLPDSAYAAAAPVGWWGRDAVSVDVFYGELARYGTWGVHSRYGRVFLPAGVSTGWQPYSVGYWRNDPRYGRLWVSSEPWGWATYHYGRWGRDSRLGWFWVPDTSFGPSWTDWRYGNGYASWSPLPPYGWDRWGYGWGNDWWIHAPGAWAWRPGMHHHSRPGRHDGWDDDRPGKPRPRPDRPPNWADDQPRQPTPVPPGVHPRSDPRRFETPATSPAYVGGERQPRAPAAVNGAYVGGERQPPREAWQGGERPGFQRAPQGVHPRSAPPTGQAMRAPETRTEARPEPRQAEASQPLARTADSRPASAPRAEPAARHESGSHPRSGPSNRRQDN
jgi:hypothetical protein